MSMRSPGSIWCVAVHPSRDCMHRLHARVGQTTQHICEPLRAAGAALQITDLDFKAVGAVQITNHDVKAVEYVLREHMWINKELTKVCSSCVRSFLPLSFAVLHPAACWQLGIATYLPLVAGLTASCVLGCFVSGRR